MPRCFWILFLLLLKPVWSWADPLNDRPLTDCKPGYREGDPALFEFVETRQQVDFQRYAGMRIASIDFITLPVFNERNPAEDRWLFRLANRLHIDTRSSTLSQQMIIAPGDTLQPERIAENERLLRENNYLIDAMILPQTVCADELHLLVVVRDVWTLIPSASAGRTGGETSSRAGLSESNLLGAGQTISLGYFDNEDRSGSTFFYSNPHIVGNHTHLQLGLEDNSDGDVTTASLARPFYKLDSTWAAGVEYFNHNFIETIELNDQELNKYRIRQERAEVFYGWSRGLVDNSVQRWRAGFASDDRQYESVDALNSQPGEDVTLRYPFVEWSWLEDRYTTLTNFVHSHRNEDVLVGFSHRVNLGYASEQWDSSQDAWVLSANTGYTASAGEHHLLRIKAAVDGHYNRDAGRAENTLYSLRGEYYHFPDARNRWYTRLTYSQGSDLYEEEALTSGGGETLRGYPDDYQRGNRQWLFTLERRHFSERHFLQLAYLGAAAYVDVGRTWDTQTSRLNNDTLANFGLGLRASPSKFSVSRVLHLDIAWPLVNRDEVDHYQIVIAGRIDF